MTGSLETAELQYKSLLEEFFISKFDEKKLPSHGLNHHRRVWQYAKGLAPVMHDNYPNLPSSLIIACYLHDIGMSLDPGINHGHHSASLAKEFLALNNLKEENFPGLISAIKDHDNKEYDYEWKNNLLTVLSVSDDLDAFGYIGIYRYIEIYHLRGTGLKELSGTIRTNAGKRFRHFERAFSKETSLIIKHKKRYEILDVFFSEYAKTAEPSGQNSGYGMVVNILAASAIEKLDAEESINLYKNSDDHIVKWYFHGFSDELKEYS